MPVKVKPGKGFELEFTEVDHSNVNERLIISMYDYSEQWCKPYIDAGYPVMPWDYKIEGDIISEKFMKEVMHYREFVYGIIAAPPCTHFAASGAQHWPKITEDSLSESIALAEWVLQMKDLCPNLKFWSLENPVGRIEKLVPELAPYRHYQFNPCDFGDPYTKKTILWGEFNNQLEKTPVEPEFVTYTSKDGRTKRMSKIAWYSGGKSEATKAKRSNTPAGFANAFFKANQ